MNRFEKWRLKRMLKGAQLDLAAFCIAKQFEGTVIPSKLASLIDAFHEHPCWDHAFAMIEFDPKFIAFLEGSKPGGLFDQQYRRAPG